MANQAAAANSSMGLDNFGGVTKSKSSTDTNNIIKNPVVSNQKKGKIIFCAC